VSRIPDKVRKALHKRAEINDFPCCEICGTPYANNAHHRRGQGQGGPNTLSNLMLLCGSGTTGCHGYVTSHPAAAVRNGWTIQGTEEEPWQVAVWYRRQGKFNLYDDGSLVPSDLEGEVA